MTRTRVVAVVAGLGIAGLVAASAAQLSVQADDLGAGVTTVASCLDAAEGEGVDVEFTVIAYDNSIVNDVGPDGGADVQGVTVTPVGVTDFDSCAGQEVTVTLVDGDQVELGSGAALITTGQDEIAVSMSPADPGTADYISAAEVEGVAVVITTAP